MARRVKAERIDFEFEQALEEAFKFELDDLALDNASDDATASERKMDGLEQEISQASEELIHSDTQPNVHEPRAARAPIANTARKNGRLAQPKAGRARKPRPSSTHQDAIFNTTQQPANDDLERKLRRARNNLAKRSSSRRLYLSTTALSALWVAGGAYFSHKIAPAAFESLSNLGQFLTTPVGLGMAAGTALPVMMFWAFAQLAKRSREMQYAVHTMTEAAMQLAQPGTNSQDKITSMGEAVRREVAAMNEGIERTLARAAELESLVQGEVNNLERAYSSNEVRIRALVNELGNERSAILDHAEQMRNSLSGVHEQLKEEIGVVADNIRTNIDAATGNLTKILSDSSADFMRNIDEKGVFLGQNLTERLNQAGQTLEQAGAQLSKALDERIQSFSEQTDQTQRVLTQNFVDNAQQFSTHVQEVMHNQNVVWDEKLGHLTQSMGQQTQETLQLLDQTSSKILDKNANLGQSLATYAEGALEKLESASQTTLDKFDDHITALGDKIIDRSNEANALLSEHNALLQHSSDQLTNAMEERVRKINESLVSHSYEIASTLHSGQKTLVSILDSGNNAIDVNLSQLSEALSYLFDTKSAELQQKLMDSQKLLNDSLSDRGDNAVQSIAAQIEALSQHLGQIEGAISAAHQAIEAKTSIVSEGNAQQNNQAAIDPKLGQSLAVLAKHAEVIETYAQNMQQRIADNEQQVGGYIKAQGAELEQRIENLRALLHDTDTHVSSALTRQSELVDQSLTRHDSLFSNGIETYQQHLDNQNSRMQDMFDNSRQELASMLRETLQGQLHEMSLQSTAIGNNLQQNGNKVDHDLMASINEQMQEFNKHSEQIRALLENSAASLTKTVEDTLQSHMQALEQHSAALRDLLSQSNNSLSQTVDGTLASQIHALENQASRLRDMFNSGAKGLSEVLTHTLENQLHGKLDQQLQQFGSQNTQQITALEQQTERMRDVFNSGAKGLSEVLTHTLENQLHGKLDQQLQEFGSYNAQIQTAGTQIHDALVNGQQNLSNLMDGSIQAFEKQISGNLDEKIAQLQGLIDQNNQVLAKTVDLQSGMVDERVEKMHTALSSALENIVQYLDRSAGNIAVSLREQITQAAQALTIEAEKAGSLLSQNSQHFSNQIIEAVNQSQDKLIIRADDMARAVNEAGQQLDQATAGFDSQLENVLSQLDNRLNNGQQQIVAHIHDATGQLENVLTTFDSKFVVNSETLGGHISNASAHLDGQLSQLGHSIEKFDQNVTTTTGSITGQIDQAASVLENNLRERTDTMAKAIISAAHGFDQHIQNSSSDIENRMTARAEQFAGALFAASTGFDKHIMEKAGSIADDLRGKAGELARVLAEAGMDFDNRVMNAADALANRITSQGQNLSTQMDGLQNQIVQSVGSFDTTLASRNDNLNALLSQRVQELDAKVADSNQQAVAQLQAQHEGLLQAFNNRAAETVQAVETAALDFNRNVSALINRMAQSSNSITQTGETLFNNFENIAHFLTDGDNAVVNKVENAARQINHSSAQLSQDINRLDSVAHNSETRLAAFMRNFEEHAQILADATQLLDMTQNTVSGSINERNHALERMSLELVQRSNAINDVMQKIESNLDSLIQSSDNRTRYIAENLQQTLTETIQQASAHFASATQDMRRAAQDIRVELDMTRSEIARNAMDLPEQTRETTQAMKKAIGEQIAALKELTGIVNKSSGQLVGAGAPAPTNSVASNSRPRRDFAEPQAPRAPVAPARPTRPAFTAPTAPQQFSPAAATRPAAPMQSKSDMRRPAKPAATRNNDNKTDRRNWVSELLQRASREDDHHTDYRANNARTPQHMLESLNALSIDIVKAIDHNKAVQLWQQYARGNHAVFTRNLYTLRGQHTFDEISARYHSDREFRQAVNQYMDEFEVLIEEIKRSQPGQVQNYLTSDTGKVYTMLAHASGRLA